MTPDFLPTCVEEPAPRARSAASTRLARAVAGTIAALLHLPGRSRTGDGSLLNMGGLAAEGNRRLADCRRAGKPLTVAVFDFPDLLEVRAIYGNAVFARLRVEVVHALEAMAGRRGVAARMGPARFAVVLPGQDRERALEVIARVLGSPSRIEYDAADSEIVLVPEFLVETVPAHASSVPTVCRGLGAEIDRMRDLQARREHHMQRDRERHSRPFALPAQDGVSKRRRTRALPVPMAQPITAGHTVTA